MYRISSQSDALPNVPSSGLNTDANAVAPPRIGWPILVIWLIGFAASIAGHMMAKEADLENRQVQFSRLANEEIHEIQTQVQNAVLITRAIRGLFNSSEAVDREEFRTFVASLELRDQIQALAWVPRVPRHLRSEYERAAAENGFPEFEFVERGTGDTLVTAGDRDEYFPVFFLEPYDGNEKKLGYDLGSNVIRSAALESARASGREVATARITLVQGTSEQYGILLCVPVYLEGRTPDEAGETLPTLAGFSVGVFGISDLVSATQYGGNGSDSPIRLQIFDKSAPRGAQQLYPRTPSHGEKTKPLAPVREEATLRFASRVWQIVATPADDTLYARAAVAPWLILALGLLVTAFVAMWVGAIVGRRAWPDIGS